MQTPDFHTRTEMNKRKQKKRKRIFVWILSFLLLSLMILFSFFQFTNFNHVEIDQSDEALGIKPSPIIKTPIVEEPESEEIIHIALFGVDRRNPKERGRSDAMMIATLDFKHDKIKLVSLMRDIYIPIEGHGHSKLNHAYAYGGPELAIKTINQNFGTDIRDYATVDFFTLEKIIDTIGGIEIDVKEEEINYVNQYMQETANLQKKEITPLVASGKQTLNGMQAVAYARIRAVGNGDFERTERQRTVLSAMIDKVQEKGKTAFPQLLLEVTPLIETSLDRSDILDYAYEYFKQHPLSLEQERFPMDGDWQSARINGGWYMKVDLKKMREQITQYLYEDKHPKDETSPERKPEGEASQDTTPSET